MTIKKKTCFIIGPIGEEKSEIRDWSDQVLKYIVSPVVTELGYEKPKRSDLIPKSGSISFEIVKHLAEDDLVIADLTNGNPNVFYELAIRHILQKPVIHLIKQGERIPFDVHDIRVISIRTDNLSAADKARIELISQINSVEEDGKTIIPHVLQIHQLRDVFEGQKSNEEKDSFINLLEQLDKIRVSVGEIKSDLADLRLNREVAPYVSPSAFLERRLAKAELVKKRTEKKE